jgi:hypothetical protein
MSPEFSNLVLPVFQRVLDLLNRVETGQRPDLLTERNEIRNEIEEAEKTAAAPSSLVRLEEFQLAKQALIYWADEVLTEALPAWEDVLLEVEYYGPPRKRARKFYVEGETKARHATPDVAETWYLALALGFRGDIRDAFKNHLNRELPGNVDNVDEARRIWAKQLEQRIRDTVPPDLPPEPLIGHVAPLHGEALLATAAVLCGLLTAALAAILYVYFHFAPTP